MDVTKLTYKQNKNGSSISTHNIDVFCQWRNQQLSMCGNANGRY